MSWSAGMRWDDCQASRGLTFCNFPCAICLVSHTYYRPLTLRLQHYGTLVGSFSVLCLWVAMGLIQFGRTYCHIILTLNMYIHVFHRACTVTLPACCTATWWRNHQRTEWRTSSPKLLALNRSAAAREGPLNPKYSFHHFLQNSVSANSNLSV